MIGQPTFGVEPWCLRATGQDLDLLDRAESVFALSNGHIGWRGNLDEGEPHGLPGSYLCGVYERRPLPYAEAGYGYPESGQTVINVTNGKVIRLLVNDEPFDVRYGELREHERILDFRQGLLFRRAVWVSPAGRAVRITSIRLVSFVQRAIAAISYQVESLDEPVRVVVQSELVANEQLPGGGNDPRVSAVLPSPLVAHEHSATGGRAALLHTTRESGLCVAAAMDHQIEGPPSTEVSGESSAHLGRTTFTAALRPGEPLRVVKYVAYGWSSCRSLPAVRDQVEAALAQARHTGWTGLRDEQREALDTFWAGADVQLEGDAEVQQAVRFGLFHLMQAGVRTEGRAIPAKGLTGTGYDGHSFWDTEAYVLMALTYLAPQAAAHALRWRHSTLPMARDRARQLGLAGAAFPWRTINGEECSGYWPAGAAAFHINAAVADAVIRYVAVAEDAGFERTMGLELLVETARLWRSLGHHDAAGRFRIDGVTGPDEYSAVADNNVYTNLMARRNLQAAAEAAKRLPERARELNVDEEEMAGWRDAASAMFIPYDEALGVHPQSEGYTRHQVWDFAATEPEHYPLLLHFPYFDLYRKQVVKQADLVLALHRCGQSFSAEQKARDFAYYERLCVRDSSLSACTQAVIAAETGHLDLAHDYLGEAARVDLDDLENNTRDGLHIASLAGGWIALVAGLGGMRDEDGVLSFAPRLPAALPRLAFTLSPRGRRLTVTVEPDHVTYTLLDGEPLELHHHGEPITVSAGSPQIRPIPALSPTVRPEQPRGRAPRRRGSPEASGPQPPPGPSPPDQPPSDPSPEVQPAE